MILLSLASKQIWPQVLAVAHLRPQKVFLLHSSDRSESAGPAQRLKRLFDKTNLAPMGATRLVQIPHDDFEELEKHFDELLSKHQLNIAECLVNFTGGNKLMATAAFRWAAKRGVRSFYLELGKTITWFTPREGDILTETEALDSRITDSLNALDLLRCQLDASEIEREGQTLTLNAKGMSLPERDFVKRVASGNALEPLLHIEGIADPERKEGDTLEFNTAAVILKLGVPRVHRSVRLKAKSGANSGRVLPHAEIDLLFNWDGRLWLVDCKDQISSEDLVKAVRRELGVRILPAAEELLRRIEDELQRSKGKVLKEDLVAIQEIGGLLGKVVCVRKADLPQEVKQYADHKKIAIVRKNELWQRFDFLLRSDRLHR